MSLPVLFCAFRILVPGGGLTRKTDDQNIIPAVSIKIICEGEKIIGIFVLDTERAFEACDFLFGALRFLADKTLRCWIDFMSLLKIWSLIPIWPRNDIDFSVMIEIAKVRSLAPEFVRKLGLFERVRNFRGREREGGGGAEWDDEQQSDHAAGLPCGSGSFKRKLRFSPAAACAGRQCLRPNRSNLQCTFEPRSLPHRL